MMLGLSAVALFVCINYADAVCLLPRHLQKHEWKYKVATAEEYNPETIQFKSNSIEIKRVDNVDGKPFVMNCVEMVDINKYLFTQNVRGQKSYQCIEIVERSKSIIQLSKSKFRSSPDRDLCYKEYLILDPWLLISYAAIDKEFIKCPFTGGFNMKVRDSNGDDHGCNYMALPMRFESECIAGEGISFNFRKDDCTSFMSMDVLQRAICITHWYHERHIFIVMKAINAATMWVLRLPRRLNTYYGSEIVMNLFTDLLAVDDDIPKNEQHYYELILQKVVQRSSCEDEYAECATQSCSSYIRNQCPKSCRTCNPETSLPVCSFPRRFRGQWYLQDQISNKDVNITDSTITINSIGNFRCVAFSDSPPRSDRMYTTESLFYNGCRPRYTCIQFKRLGPSVIGYALSQSFVWPIAEKDRGKMICDKFRFQSDVSPIGDTYHSYADTVKPILPLSISLIPTSCNLPSTYSFQTSIAHLGNCSGTLSQDCANSSKLRIDFDYCKLQKWHASYVCVATFSGRYWEKLIILQNEFDKRHSACLAFTTMKQNDAILLPTSQCDQYAWQFVDAKIRNPLIAFTLTQNEEKCKNAPTTTTTTTTVASMPVKSGGFHKLQSDTHEQASALNEKEYAIVNTTPKNSEAKITTRKTKTLSNSGPRNDINNVNNIEGLSPNRSNFIHASTVNLLFISVGVTFVSYIHLIF